MRLCGGLTPPGAALLPHINPRVLGEELLMGGGQKLLMGRGGQELQMGRGGGKVQERSPDSQTPPALG